MENSLLIIAAIGLGYLIGSIPFGLVLTRLAGLGDIRTIGSGNIGATNVLRTGRKGLALATLLLDGGKGAIAALIFHFWLGTEAGLAAGAAAVIGHNFPVWLKFKGGKGVATTLGTIIAMAWPIGLAACGTWIVTAAIFRYSSLAALIALAAAPLYAWFYASPLHAYVFAGLAILGWARHHANISRLLKGQEPEIGKKKEG
jgi:glycerol-3-phosphate acyltransferase PlsY